MLFLKRLSDLFDQERDQLAKDLKAKGMPAGALAKQLENPDKYTFFVPEEARWNKVRHLKENVGSSLNKALEALEEANVDALQDVLKHINFAKMAINIPGECEPTGGERVGEVKPINPTFFANHCRKN